VSEEEDKVSRVKDRIRSKESWVSQLSGLFCRVEVKCKTEVRKRSRKVKMVGGVRQVER
jgi:predicted HAD superfamily phosphohydrolase